MHLEVEQIQRMIHGEVDAPARATIARHLEECEVCRRRLEEAEREEEQVFDLLLRVDRDAPPVTAAVLSRRARGGGSVWRRMAAGFVLAILVAGAVAYALPGSVVRAWMERAVTWIASMGSPEASPTGEGAARSPGGIAVVPGDRFVVRFLATQSKGAVTVSLTDGTEVVARAIGGTATFTTMEDGLLIDNRGSAADFSIDLPRASRQLEILIEGRRMWLKEGNRVLTPAPLGPSGSYVLPLGANRP